MAAASQRPEAAAAAEVPEVPKAKAAEQSVEDLGKPMAPQDFAESEAAAPAEIATAPLPSALRGAKALCGGRGESASGPPVGDWRSGLGQQRPLVMHPEAAGGGSRRVSLTCMRRTARVLCVSF